MNRGTGGNGGAGLALSAVGFRRMSAVVVTAALVAAMFTGSVTVAAASQGEDLTSIEIATALSAMEGVDGQLVAEPVPTTSDEDSAASLVTEAATVEVPRDAEGGVSLALKGEAPIVIALPNAAEASNAIRLPDGTVTYPSDGGSATAVVVSEKGIQMLTTIEDANAPVEFRYDLALPEGGRVVLTDDNGARVVGADGSTELTVAPAWAKDAHGTEVPTRYTTEGTTLIQIVDHSDGDFSYPLVADPFWVAPAAIVAAFQAAVWACGLGYLAGSAWQIFWNGWVWDQVRRAGREGCVEGVIGRFIPWSWVRGLIKR